MVPTDDNSHTNLHASFHNAVMHEDILLKHHWVNGRHFSWQVIK